VSLRDPIEVCVSLLTHQPGWFRTTNDASRALVKAIDPAGASTSREDFAARVYGAFCEAASRLDRQRGKLVHYEGLPAAIWESVASHFALPVDAAQKDAIAAVARTHAKAAIGRPAAFVADAASKQAAASPELRRAIDAFARPALEHLKQKHAS
jgi:hypothetical protein